MDSKMLSRPSFSIRRLIPQRKSDGSENDDSPFTTHDISDSIRSSKDFKVRTWPKRKGPIPTIDIRRSEDLHRIVVLPSLPDTPKSWAGSVGSCDDDTSFVCPRSSPAPPIPIYDRSPQRSPNQTPQRSPLLNPQQHEYPQRIRSRSLGPLASRSIFPHSPPSSPQFRPRRDESSPRPSADLAEAYFAETGELANPEWTTGTGLGVSPAISEDLEQLIRETEEAFRLRHSFSGARLPSPLLSSFRKSDTARSDPELVRQASLARRTSQRSNQSSIKSAKAQTKASLKTPASTTQNKKASVSATKKQRQKKTRRRPRASTAGTTSKWTLSESAKDLFSIKIFNKIEADEMLPESVLHEIRMSRATQARLARETAESGTDVETTASPTESEISLFSEFPLPPSATRFDTQAVISKRPDAPRPLISTHIEQHRPAMQESLQESPVDVIALYKYDETSVPTTVTTEDHPAPLKIQGNREAPPPPIKNPHRRSPNKHALPLPTIPEVAAIDPEAFLSPTSRRRATAGINTDEYVFLPCAPFTFTLPTFRHGPIRLAKADLPIGQLAAAVDDTLDWTAFQMAILGGAGDFFGESTDFSRPSDAELSERDEIIAWFDEFGFDGPGALVSAADAMWVPRAEAPSPRDPLNAPLPPLPSVVITKAAGVELPVEAPLRGMMRVEPPLLLPPAYLLSSCGIGAGQEGVGTGFQHYLEQSGGGAEYQDSQHGGLQVDPMNRASVDSVSSLPQSPMQDLVVSHDVNKNEYVVPMGCNLGHDLGDFLRWEAEHVFGGGYYGPDSM